jgi:hypothetical protein
MSWRAISATNITGRMTVSEQAMLAATAGAASKLQERLTDSKAAFTGAMNAVGWDTDPAGNTIPDQLRNHVMAYAVEEWLRDFPKLVEFNTQDRKDAYKEACLALEKIQHRTFGAIESFSGTDKTTGNWNSKPKLMMRTDPHPQPIDQLQLAPTNPYANPNAPGDQVPSDSPGLPEAPLNVQALAVNGTVLLYWLPALNAVSYTIYRSTVTGQEIPPGQSNPTPLADSVTGSNYTDTTVTSGQAYYYQVVAVGLNGSSGLSNEASATP